MKILSQLLIVGSLLLPACASYLTHPVAPAPPPLVLPASPLVQWVEFASELEPLNSSELLAKRNNLRASYAQAPNNEQRMRLAYLLSRPNPATQNFAKSLALLAELEPNSHFAPLRNMIQREITLSKQLNATRQKLQELQNQLNTLKAIDGDLTESQKTIDEVSQ